MDSIKSIFGKIKEKYNAKKTESESINKEAEENVKRNMPQGAGSSAAHASAVAKEISAIRKRRGKMGKTIVFDPAKRKAAKDRIKKLARNRPQDMY